MGILNSPSDLGLGSYIFIVLFKANLYLLRSSIAPGSGLTLIAIERVSTPLSPEVIELLKNDQSPKILISISHSRPKRARLSVVTC